MRQLQNALWRFSLAHYRRPGVAMACLALQDRGGLDVNMLLFALWHGASGRGRLSRGALARIARAVGPWQGHVVVPLRQMRQRLKPLAENPALGPLREAIAALRGEIKRLELEAERVEQAMLFAMAKPTPVGRPAAAARVAAAAANVSAYLKLTAGRPGTRLSRELATVLAPLGPGKSLHRKHDSRRRRPARGHRPGTGSAASA